MVLSPKLEALRSSYVGVIVISSLVASAVIPFDSTTICAASAETTTLTPSFPPVAALPIVMCLPTAGIVNAVPLACAMILEHCQNLQCL